MEQRPNADRAARYTILVEGRLSKSWSEWFSGMEVTFEGQNDAIPITKLAGVLTDQVALRGILIRIWDLNLTVVSVERIEETPERVERKRNDRNDSIVR